MGDIKHFDVLLPDGEMTKEELTAYLSSICPSFRAEKFYEDFNENNTLPILFADKDGIVYRNTLYLTENTEENDDLFYRNYGFIDRKMFNGEDLDLSGGSYNNDDYDDRFGYLERDEYYDEEQRDEDDYFYEEDDYPDTHITRKKFYYSFEDEWRRCFKLCNAIFLNSMEEIIDILKNNYPHAYIYTKKFRHPEYILLSPELEQLTKAGYKFAEHILDDGFRNEEALDYKHIVHSGKNPAEIFKGIYKPVYTALKNEISLAKWQRYNYLYGVSALTKEDLPVYVKSGYSVKALINMDGILYSIDGRGVHRGCMSPKKLTGYLKKVKKATGLTDTKITDLLADYIKVCVDLNIKPNFERYNLIKEHDRVVKILNETKDSLYDKEIKADYDKNMPLCMKENGFFIRPVKNRKELNEEGEDQHNCVAAYGKDIAAGRCHIFVMRRIHNPKKSYITVEIDPYGKIKQALQENNEEIGSYEANNFLNKWEKRTREFYTNLVKT